MDDERSWWLNLEPKCFSKSKSVLLIVLTKQKKITFYSHLPYGGSIRIDGLAFPTNVPSGLHCKVP